jgi:hypothetical protein
MSPPSIVHIEELLPGSIGGVHLNGIGGVVEGEAVEFLEVLDPPAANRVQRSHAVLVLEMEMGSLMFEPKSVTILRHRTPYCNSNFLNFYVW